MAAVQLIEPAAAPSPSADQTLDNGDMATIIPRPLGGGARVMVQVKDSADEYHTIASLVNDPYQVRGPMVFRVTARNAGCDAELPGV